MSHGYDWRKVLTNEERAHIAQRGPIDCRPADASLDDVVPCRGCHCWLMKAFKHARTEKVQARRRARLQVFAAPHGVTDGAQHTIWASSTDSSKKGTDWLLAALKQVHPDRDPHPNLSADPDDEDAA